MREEEATADEGGGTAGVIIIAELGAAEIKHLVQQNLLRGGVSLVQDVEGLPAHTAPPVVPDDGRAQSSYRI